VERHDALEVAGRGEHLRAADDHLAGPGWGGVVVVVVGGDVAGRVGVSQIDSWERCWRGARAVIQPSNRYPQSPYILLSRYRSACAHLSTAPLPRGGRAYLLAVVTVMCNVCVCTEYGYTALYGSSAHLNAALARHVVGGHSYKTEYD
jgi:hypothetical protein